MKQPLNNKVLDRQSIDHQSATPQSQVTQSNYPKPALSKKGATKEKTRSKDDAIFEMKSLVVGFILIVIILLTCLLFPTIS